jgi:DNA-binding beta-propeller fold protein YncE
VLIPDLPGYSEDVAVDSSGNLYVSTENWSNQVFKYDSLGNDLGAFAGVYRVPYLTAPPYLHNPAGLAVDSSGNIYVVENRGHRLVKLDPSGAQLWAIGEPGIFLSDDYHFAHSNGNPAIDVAGRVYISNTNRHRVQIYNSDGSFYDSIGELSVSGSDNDHFNYPQSVAISPLNGDIYVADRDNQRVQVFTSTLQWKATLGQTGVSGIDNAHFNGPRGVAVDWSGNVYVADRENQRVQKFNSSHAYVDTLGVTGVCSASLDHFCSPSAVAVDRLGRVYIADSGQHRVQVFDANGGYLATIGGAWGILTGQLRGPAGVAVDRAGAVYVADANNHRVQKYSPAILGWTQRNLNGFGERENGYIATLASFQNQLYAGTYNDNGGQLWRSSDGLNWTAVRKDGLGDFANIIIDDLVEFDGMLYAGTGNENGAQIWRSDDGAAWGQVTPPGLDPTNTEFMLLEVFENMLYAATASSTTDHGTEIWRSSTGNSADWTRVVSNGLGDADNAVVTNFTEFNGYLYVGLWNAVDGAEVWRSDTGASWTRVATAGFGDVYNTTIGGMAVFAGQLYVGTSNYTGSNNPGAEMWRCTLCNGSDWEMVPISKGLGDTENRSIYLVAYRDDLLALTNNRTNGLEAWRSPNGENWQQVNLDGFGTCNNTQPYWENGIEIFNGSLYVAAINFRNGGQIWMYLPVRMHLPLVSR